MLKTKWQKNILKIALCNAIIVSVSSLAIPRIDGVLNTHLSSGPMLLVELIWNMAVIALLSVLSYRYAHRFIADTRSVAVVLLPSLVAIEAINNQLGLFYVSPTYQNSLPLSVIGYPLFVLSLIFSSAYLILLVCISLWKFAHYRLMATVLLSLVMSLGLYFGITMFGAHYADYRAAQEVKRTVLSVNFTVYQPTYSPHGYVTNSTATFAMAGTDAYTETISSNTYEHTHYEFTYSYPYDQKTYNYTNPTSDYTLFEYPKGDDYMPPSNCGSSLNKIEAAGGSLSPVTSSHPCVLYDHSSIGCDIYLEQHSSPLAYRYYYCDVGTTTLVLRIDDRFTDIRTEGNQKVEIQNIFNSLAVAPKEELLQLENSRLK